VRTFITALSLLTICLLPSCASCPPEAIARNLRPNFDTPIEAGKCFFAALACDQADAEYRCLSEDLKQSYGATMDAWLIARQDLRAEVGVAISQAHKLKALSSEQHDEGMLVWWGLEENKLIGLIMHQQHYFDIYVTNGEKVGAFLDLPPSALIEIDGRRLRLELNNSLLRTMRNNSAVNKIIIGSEWKLGGVIDPK